MKVNRTDRVDNRMNVRSDRNDAKLGDFRDFTKSYSCTVLSKRNMRVLDEERRQLREQVAGIVQELHNVSKLTDTDCRVLNISRAVAFLLEGR